MNTRAKVTALVQAVDKWFGAEMLAHVLRDSVGRQARLANEYNASDMSFLRFLMLLALVVWIGGIIFLAFVEAPTAFTPGLLPSRHMAGSIVGRSLDLLHFMGIASGIVFLIASSLYYRLTAGRVHPLAIRHVLIALMLGLTLISQFKVSPRMHALRAQAGVIDNLAPDDPVRREFDRLHVWSEKFEEAVLLLGLLALFRTAQELR